MHALSLRYAAPVIAAVLAFASLTAHAETQTRSVSGFSSVTFASAGKVEIAVGPEASLTLEGDPDVLSEVTTEVVDGTLEIERNNHFSLFSLFSKREGRITARITLPRLKGFTIAGSANTNITGLDGGNTSITIAGSGDVRASGHVDRLAVTIAGSGNVHGQDLAADTAAVSINGSGDVVVDAHKSLNASINGSGKILYVNPPEKIASSINGSGTIKQQ